MRQLKLMHGKRYIRAYTEDATGTRSAVAFFDKQRGLWFEAASWDRPSYRLAPAPAPAPSPDPDRTEEEK